MMDDIIFEVVYSTSYLDVDQEFGSKPVHDYIKKFDTDLFSSYEQHYGISLRLNKIG
jgi:hypothetical protein